MKLYDVVEVLDKDKLLSDEHLNATAKDIISANHFRGVITKISDDIFFVGFKNEIGWVTQGYKADEIEVITHG